MYQKVKAYVQKYHMLTSGDKVIIGVSGGADSICLLFVLIRLGEEMGFAVHAVHVHHGIRGESADRDAAYVQEVCAGEGVPLSVCRRDVPLYAKEHRLTEEEAGREIRREVFLHALKEQAGTKIALAHHRGDNAETVLHNLCRGTGLKGMGGIAPVSGVWIRPFLCVMREEIESYLEKRGISYCIDETNLENAYTRNKLRNEVLPYLQKNINKRAVLHIAETAEQMQALGEYVREEARRRKEDCVERGRHGRLLLLEKEYRDMPEALRPYILYEVVCEAAGRRKDIESVHVRLAGELFSRQPGRRLDLPYGLTAERCYEGIRFVKECGDREETPAGEFRFRLIETGGGREVFPQNPYTKWFDYDIIQHTVKMRHREPGDYLTIDKRGNTKKLKQYFIHEKIPREERNRIWLAADGQHIMWVVGYRQNQAYQVTEETKRVLEITYYGGKEDAGEGKSDD